VTGRRLPICAICGRHPSGSYFISMRGSVSCAHHAALRCCLCSHRATVEQVARGGWASFTAKHLRCPACGDRAVESHHQLLRNVQPIRMHMRAGGFQLDTPVRIRFGRNDLPPTTTPTRSPFIQGQTRTHLRDGRVTSLEVMVLRGLPPEWFGWTVIHEYVHAWLRQQGVHGLPLVVEEGLAELVAHDWATSRRSPVASGLAEQCEKSPDPVYGSGLRRCLAGFRAANLPLIEFVRRTAAESDRS
jgi:hypothetical protein